MDSTLSFAAALGAAHAFAGGPAETPQTGVACDTLLYRHLAAHEYHGDRDALSCSMMKPLLVSPAHFQEALIAGDKQSDAKDFGTLVHLLLLQPHLVSEELAVYPGVADRTQACSSFWSSHPGRLVVDEPTFASGRRLAQKLAETPYKGRPLQRFIEEGIPEATIYFTEPATGLRMRVRIDLMHPDISFDLKTTRHAAARQFVRDAVDKDYDLQAYMYSLARCLYEGATVAKPFVFVAGESAAPHSVHILTAGETLLNNGLAKFEDCASAFKACSSTNFWPDLSSEGVADIDVWQQHKTGSWRAALASAAGSTHAH